MKASRVHSVVAAGLEDPRLLERWQREPSLLSSCGVDPDKCDLNALWKFAGLTAKVRHNGLRADLPMTFRLLNVAGLEIEVFGSYASFCASEGARYADTSEERAQDLVVFLERWLDFDRLEHVLLWDVIRYELALARLSRLACAPAAESPLPWSPRATSRPRVWGDIVLHEMRCDPRSVGLVLQEKSPRLDTVPLGRFRFCYWRKVGGAEIHILELDQLGFYLLSLADGEHSIADLSRLLGGSGRPPRGMLNAVSELAGVGILELSAAVDKPHESAAGR